MTRGGMGVKKLEIWGDVIYGWSLTLNIRQFPGHLPPAPSVATSRAKSMNHREKIRRKFWEVFFLCQKKLPLLNIVFEIRIAGCGFLGQFFSSYQSCSWTNVDAHCPNLIAYPHVKHRSLF